MLTLQRSLMSVFAFTASYLLIALFASTSTFAATATWDGEGADTNFTTAANWAGDTVPVSGDDLVFDTDTADFSSDLNNDMTTGTAFTSVSIQGSESETITIAGNAADIGDVTAVQVLDLELDITLAADATYSGSAQINIGLLDGSNTLNLGSYVLTGQTGLAIRSVISGAGGIIQSSGDLNLYAANTYDGVTSIVSGASLTILNPASLGSGVGSTDIANGAALYVMVGDFNGSPFTVAEAIAIGGVGGVQGAAMHIGEYSLFPGAGPASAGTSVTFSGAVTLSGDTTVGATNFLENLPISMPNVNEGAYTLSLLSANYGDWTINGQAPGESEDTVTIEDSQPSVPVSVLNGKTYVINGTRGATTVDAGGILKGTGTVGDLNVATSGRLAPGLSPGCMSTGNLTFNSGSTYEVEINGTTVCSQYDQTQVTGTVTLGDAALDLRRLASFTPLVGNAFTIIDNDAADAVVGTFNALAEGATVVVGTVTYQASYIGGDGNDVTLTVTAVSGTVGAPATGFSLSVVNPVVVLGAVALSIVGVLASQKRLVGYKK